MHPKGRITDPDIAGHTARNKGGDSGTISGHEAYLLNYRSRGHTNRHVPGVLAGPCENSLFRAIDVSLPHKRTNSEHTV
jgi:hypothetical protein